MRFRRERSHLLVCFEKLLVLGCCRSESTALRRGYCELRAFGVRVLLGLRMELTPEFTKCVRRARERHLGSASAPADRIVRKRKEKSPVHTAADQIVRPSLNHNAAPCRSRIERCDLQVSHLARLSDSVATCRPAYLNFRGLGSHAGTIEHDCDCMPKAALQLCWT